MASAENQQHTFPTVPPSLSAGDYEMRDYYTAQDAPRPTPIQAPYHTPYLGLRARLSQIWFNRWTVLILLLLVKILLVTQGLNSDLASARREALSACSSVETVGSTVASLPHYAAQGVNELTAHGVNTAVAGLMSMVTMSVTGVEEIVIFAINTMTQTYLCLITLAVTGGLHLALDAAEDITSFVNNTLPGIGQDIKTDVTNFDNDLNKFIGALNSIPKVFGGSSGSIPTLNIDGDLNKLNNLSLPSGIDDSIAKINSSIPTFADVNNFTQSALRFPFDELKQLINSSMGNYTFNGSVFPVPQKEQLTFCSDNNGINDFFNGLGDLVNLARKVFTGVMVVLALLVMIPMSIREIRRWRMQQRRAILVSKNAFDPMDVVYISSRPYTSTFGIKIASRFSNIRTQVRFRWAIAYCTTIPALLVLTLGVAGLLGCLMQYILLKTVQHEVPELTNQVANFTGKVVDSLNNASQQWALGANDVITHTSDTINNDMLGWVNISTTALNNTLNTFVDETTNVLNKTFGGTPLYGAITDVLNCLIGLKIQGIQKGLTWVQDHAHIDFPLLPNDTLSLGALAQMTNSSTAEELVSDPSGTTANDITSGVNYVTGKLEDAIRQEAIISSVLVAIWLLVAIGGFVWAFIHVGKGRTRAEGGRAYSIDPETDNNRGHDIAPPYEEAYANKEPAPYVLEPRPFPNFNDEKLGAVNTGHIAEIPPSHARQSSYGALQGTTPIEDEKAGLDPFADPPH